MAWKKYQFKMLMVHEGLEQFVPGMGNRAESDTKMCSAGKIRRFSANYLRQNFSNINL